MQIVADENIALLNEFFGHFGELRCYAGRQLSAAQVKSADVLLVRSVTPVNAALLQDSSVCFVGSATIGFDHMDQTWLAEQKITVRTAPACNAQSVVEYVFAALAYVSKTKKISLQNKVLGVVGLGNVGSLLARLAQKLGFEVIGYDPFTHHADIQQVELADLLQQADVVSCHTPLTTTGTYSSYHLLNAHNLPLLKSGAILLNAGRGAAIDNQALLDFITLNPKHLGALILDVWENEPLPNRCLAHKTDLITPHIAGYSLEGKWRGTEMIYSALCEFLHQAPQHQLADFLPPLSQSLSWPLLASLWQNYAHLLQSIYPIQHDDHAFRKTLDIVTDNERASAFDALRKNYWPRRECSAFRLNVAPVADIAQLKYLGFKIII